MVKHEKLRYKFAWQPAAAPDYVMRADEKNAAHGCDTNPVKNFFFSFYFQILLGSLHAFAISCQFDYTSSCNIIL